MVECLSNNELKCFVIMHVDLVQHFTLTNDIKGPTTHNNTNENGKKLTISSLNKHQIHIFVCLSVLRGPFYYRPI